MHPVFIGHKEGVKMNWERSKQINLKKEKSIGRENLIGNREFYSHVAIVAIPMIIQNTLSNVVSLLDNVMVGQIGTLPMSAVAIVNQILMVFYVCLWGALAGVGIFSTQFFGKGDYKGVRYSLRFKILTAFVLCIVALTIFWLAGPYLVNLYISADTTVADKATTMYLAMQYMHVMLFGVFLFGVTQCYASVLRESGQTILPMQASIIAMVVNFILNLCLIFGLFFFPRLGVAGAALATVIARIVECLIVVLGAHCNKKKYHFLVNMYKEFYIPAQIIKPFLFKMLPLLWNEFLWSLGQAVLLQSYSIRGIQVIAAMNISGTISQIFNEVFLSLGNATSILVGQELGANHLKNAKQTAWRMILLSVVSCILLGILLLVFAPVIPHLYITEGDIKKLATRCIMVVSICMPINAFSNIAYFTLRSGGKTFMTFLFDSCFVWAVSVPIAFFLTHNTELPVIVIFFFVSIAEIIKCMIGFGLLKSGVWVKNIVRTVA